MCQIEKVFLDPSDTLRMYKTINTCNRRPKFCALVENILDFDFLLSEFCLFLPSFDALLTHYLDLGLYLNHI